MARPVIVFPSPLRGFVVGAAPRRASRACPTSSPTGWGPLIPLTLTLLVACTDLGTAPAHTAGEDTAPVTDAAPPVDPLAVWAGCMSLERWQAATMGAWASKPSSLGSICSDCHADGLAFFNASAAAEEMFAANRTRRFVTGFFTLTTDEESGVVDVAPAWSKLRAKGEGQNNHPLFAVGPGERYFQYLEAFARATREARDAGQCDPPPF